MRLVGLISSTGCARGAVAIGAAQPCSAASESSFDLKTPRAPCLPRALACSLARFASSRIFASVATSSPPPYTYSSAHKKPIPNAPTTTSDSQQPDFIDSDLSPLPPPRLQQTDPQNPPADRIRNRGNHTKWRCYKIPITVTVVVITTAAAPRANRAGAATPRPLPTPSMPAPWR